MFLTLPNLIQIPPHQQCISHWRHCGNPLFMLFMYLPVFLFPSSALMSSCSCNAYVFHFLGVLFYLFIFLVVQCVPPNNGGLVGVRIIPNTVWLLTCFFGNSKTNLSGPEEDGCIGIVSTTFIFDLPFSFLALVHFLLALIILLFCGTNLRLSSLCYAAFSFV